jgi:hypothetical protein
MEDLTCPVLMPRLCRGVAIIEATDSIIIEGTPRRRRIRSAAEAGTAGLFKLLDGTHDSEAICTALGLDPEDLHKSLSRLSASGVLEWIGPTTASPDSPQRHVMDYYARNISLSPDHGCAESLAATLTDALVVLAGATTITALLSADLAEAGVGTIVAPSTSDELRAAISDMAPTHAPRLVVAADRAGSPDQFGDIVTLCGTKTVPVLRYSLGADGFEIGPVFLPGSTACVECFRRSDLPFAGCLDGSRDIAQLEQQSMAGLLAGLVGVEILALVGRTQRPRKWHELTRVDCECTTQMYEVVPDTRCGCGTGITAEPDTRDIAAYEWLQTDRPGPPPWRWPTHEGPTRTAGTARRRRALYTAPRIRLEDGLGAAPETPLTSASLGYLLSHVASARGWANWDGVAAERFPAQDAEPPECPPLTDLYVLTRGDPLGLGENCFVYDDAGHEAIAMRSDPLSIDQLLPGVDASIALVMGGAFRRMVADFGDLAPRLAQLDAGSTLLNLIVAANALGWKVTHVSSWDASIAEALNLDLSSQPITLIAGISIPGNTLGQRVDQHAYL